ATTPSASTGSHRKSPTTTARPRSARSGTSHRMYGPSTRAVHAGRVADVRDARRARSRSTEGVDHGVHGVHKFSSMSHHKQVLVAARDVASRDALRLLKPVT